MGDFNREFSVKKLPRGEVAFRFLTDQRTWVPSVSEVDSFSLKSCTRWRTFCIVELGHARARSGIDVGNVGTSPGDGAGKSYRNLQGAGVNLEGVVGQI